MVRISLKQFNQKENYSCGPVALRIVFNFFGKICSENELIKKTHTKPLKGVQNSDLINVLKNTSFFYYEKENSSLDDIKSFLKKKLPVIVNYTNPNSSQGHYAVIFGYNEIKKEFCFADPSNGFDFKLNEKDFFKKWQVKGEKTKRWLLVIKNKPF